MKRLIPLILVLVLCMWTSPEADQIYQWIDRNGVTHFTNEPPPPGAKIVNEQKAIQYNEAADQKNMQEQQEFLDQDSDQDSQQQESQTDQQEESQPDSPAVQTDYSESDDSDGDAVVHPYVRPSERAREYERRKEEGEEIVTPLPARERVRVRRR